MEEHVDNCSDDNGTLLSKDCGNYCSTMELAFLPHRLIATKSSGLGKSPSYKTIIEMTDRISSNYEWVMSLGDNRVSDWPLMRSPAPTIVITIAYVMICWKGNRYLRREDNGSRGQVISNSIMGIVLVAYNTLLIVLNAYIVIRLWEPCTVYHIQCHPGIYDEQTSSCITRKALLILLAYVPIDFSVK